MWRWSIARLLASMQPQRCFASRSGRHRQGGCALEGRFREAEKLAERANDEEKRLGAGSPQLALVRILIRRETGDAIDNAAGFPPEMIDVPQVRAALAVTAIDQHRDADARTHLDRGAATAFARLGQDWIGSCAVAHFAETCAALAERSHARALYDALRSHAGLTVSFNYHFCLGAAARYFGLLAATLEEWDRAVEHLRGRRQARASRLSRPDRGAASGTGGSRSLQRRRSCRPRSVGDGMPH